MFASSFRFPAPPRRTGGLLRAAFLAAAAAVLVAAPVAAQSRLAPSAADPNEFHWQGQVPADGSIEIKGVFGDVRAVPTTGNRVQVTAIRRPATRGSVEDVELHLVEHAGGVTICAVYPSPAGSPRNECGPGDLERLNVRNVDVIVDFTVHVPAGVAFAARTVRGDVQAGALGGGVSAFTGAGDIRLEMDGAVGTHRMEAVSTAGSIVVAVGPRAAAEVEASTLTGRVFSDFSLEVSGGRLGKRASGTIGAGGSELRLRTVAGDIRVVRS